MHIYIFVIFKLHKSGIVDNQFYGEPIKIFCSFDINITSYDTLYFQPNIASHTVGCIDILKYCTQSL